MDDDIVTRLRNFTCQELNCKSDEMAGEAVEEIERLRDDLQRSLLQTNVMRNIALVPLDKQGEKIEQLLADRDKWRRIALDEHAGWCQLHHPGSCEEYIVQQLAVRNGL